MRKFLSSVLLGVVLFSCKEEDVITDPGAMKYLPLEVGNKWEFEYQEFKEVVGTKNISGKIYFALKSNYDTSFYRIENNKVYISYRNEPEKMIFKLDAAKNETWNYGSFKVKMASKTDTITINNKKISNCFHFYFDIPVAVDDEHSIWLAPEIGFIQEQYGECLHPERRLIKAKINGKDLVF